MITNQSQSQSISDPLGEGSLNQLSTDRQKYGSLLPKSGVYFLPDEKVVGFLK
jgi:hypothetical protein